MTWWGQGTRVMPDGWLTGRRGRVQAVSAVLAALTVAAVVVTVWRFEEAVSRSGAAAGALRGSGLAVARAALAHAAAAAAAEQALWAGVTAAALTVVAGLVPGWYLTQLMRRAEGRTEENRITLVQRDELSARLASASAILGEVAGQIRARAAEAVAATTQISQAVAETSATVEELAVSAGSVAENTSAARNAAAQVEDTMQDMHQQVDSIAAGALSLGERTGEISEILELINQFTGQTNLLALNAAIEAARAGEAGRGFAVVADEVRKLAQRSIHSTDSISAIITAVQDEANTMIAATGGGARHADQVGELMRSTATMLQESVLATQQQKSATDQADAALQQIRAATDELAIGQHLRFTHAERLEVLVRDIEAALQPSRAQTAPTSRRSRGPAPTAPFPATPATSTDTGKVPATADSAESRPPSRAGTGR